MAMLFQLVEAEYLKDLLLNSRQNKVITKST